MFENLRRGRQARNFTTNAPKILNLKSSSEQMFSRKLPLGAPGRCFLFPCTVFFFSPFGFLYSYCWPCRSWTWINDILSLSPEFYFGKGISKALYLHTGQAYDQIKTISPVKTCPSSETAEFFSMLVDIMTNNTQYTTNCTNLHPTPTSDPLAKVKLAFCTSS